MTVNWNAVSWGAFGAFVFSIVVAGIGAAAIVIRADERFQTTMACVKLATTEDQLALCKKLRAP